MTAVLALAVLLGEIAAVEMEAEDSKRLTSILTALAEEFAAEFSTPSPDPTQDERLQAILYREDDFQRARKAPNKLDALTLLLRKALADGLPTSSPQNRAASAGLQQLNKDLMMCRKHRSTPMPTTYFIHLRLVMCMSLATIPFWLNSVAGPLWTVPITLLASYSFFGLDAVSSELLNPFGDDYDDLDVKSYAKAAVARLSLVASFWKDDDSAAAVPADTELVFTSA